MIFNSIFKWFRLRFSSSNQSPLSEDEYYTYLFTKNHEYSSKVPNNEEMERWLNIKILLEKAVAIKGGKNFVPVGFLGIITVGFILSFYSIIAGTMIAYFIAPILQLVGASNAAVWVTSQGVASNMIFASLFFFITILICVLEFEQESV